MGGGGRGGGGGTGKAEFSDINFSKQADKSSPKLVKAAAEGEHIKEVVLTCRKASGKGGQVEYLKVTMNDVMVSSYQTGGSSGASSIPMDQFSLNFRSEEHTSELQSLMRISYAVFCLKKKNKNKKMTNMQQ